MVIIPEEVEYMIKGFLFTYPEVDCEDMKLKNPKFVNYMKSIAVRTVEVVGFNVEFCVDGIRHNEDSPTISNDHSYRYKNGVYHSEGDKPTIVYQSGDQCWYKDGKLHREDDKPAVVCQNGNQYWYKDGSLHREGDKPATVYLNNYQCWYKDGELHREGNKPAIVCQSDSQ